MMDTMESSFYHDSVITKKGVMLKKNEMHLDFSKQSAMKSRKKFTDGILNSPDVNLLKLASPELERMIIQQGTITTTPTPTTQILFPKSVTEEQEAYARGFVDALAELHQTQGKSPEESCDSDVLPQTSTYTTLTTLSNVPSSTTSSSQFSTAVNNAARNNNNNNNALVKTSSGLVGIPSTSGFSSYTTIAPLPGSVLSQNVPSSSSALSATVPSSMNTSRPEAGTTQEILVYNQPMTATTVARNQSPAMQFSTSTTGQHTQLMQIKSEEPQRVPSLSPQLAPINMEAQEGIKLERKRARNRVAARKCRTRKLERISRLEDRVSELKGQNTTLVQTASELREQVYKLKQQILQHVDSGCKVMLSANML